MTTQAADRAENTVTIRFGKSMGGWIHKPESNAEWKDWQKLLME